MEVVFLGHASFRLKGKIASLVTDPYDSEMVGFKFPKVAADIVTISHNHKDHNQASLVKDVSKVVSGPGEYEIKGVSIMGFLTYHDNLKGEARGENTIYLIEMDEVRLVHLGDLGHKISEELQDRLGEVDVLMIPVGGEYTIGPTEAAELVRMIEPKIILPMHYQMRGLNQQIFAKLSPVDAFLSQVGLPVEKADKLSIKKDALREEQKVVVLARR